MTLSFALQSRKLEKNIEDIVTVIDKRRALSHDETFLREICHDLGIPNSKINRTRLKHGYLRYKKVMVSRSNFDISKSLWT